MRTDKELVIPYASYITLGIVALVFTLMILFKLAARDNRFLSNSELYIYSQPDQNQRKHNANKKQRKNTFAPTSIKLTTSAPSLD